MTFPQSKYQPFINVNLKSSHLFYISRWWKKLSKLSGKVCESYPEQRCSASRRGKLRHTVYDSSWFSFEKYLISLWFFISIFSHTCTIIPCHGCLSGIFSFAFSLYKLSLKSYPLKILRQQNIATDPSTLSHHWGRCWYSSCLTLTSDGEFQEGGEERLLLCDEMWQLVHLTLKIWQRKHKILHHYNQ